MSIAETKGRIDALCDGFMTPIFQELPPGGGEPLNGLGPEDFARVRHGYGCPRCLAKFKTYLVECPVCHYLRDVERDFREAPQLWIDHLNERHKGETEKTRPLTFDEFMAEVAKDPGVEKVKL